ncbi:MAG: GAF domain-containing sensor histidine kinase [Acidimicrobiia bacterium]
MTARSTQRHGGDPLRPDRLTRASLEREARAAGVRLSPVGVRGSVHRRAWELVALVALPLLVVAIVMLLPPEVFPEETVGRGPVAAALLLVSAVLAVYGLVRASHLRRLLGLLAAEEERSSQLVRDVNRSAALLRAAVTVNSVAEPREVLDEILAAALELFGCDDGAVLRSDAENIEIVASRGRFAAGDETLRAARSIIGHVLRTRDAALGSLRVAERPLREGTQAGTAMAAPMLHRGSLVGVVLLEAPRGAHFEDSEIATLSLFAGHAAMAMANSRLRALETEQIAALLESDKVRRELMVLAGHELRTPITVMRTAAAGAARMGSVQSDPHAALEQQGLLDLIDAQAKRFDEMTAHLTEEWRRAGSIHVPLRAVDLTARVDRHTRDARAAGTPVEFRPGEPCVVTANEEAVDRILGSLLENATRHARGPIRCTIERDVTRAVMTVSDGGPGLDEERRRRIFEPGHGRGRGLTVVRGLAEACRGTVWAEPSPSGGTAFRVAFRRVGSRTDRPDVHVEGPVPTQASTGPVADVRSPTMPDTSPAPVPERRASGSNA